MINCMFIYTWLQMLFEGNPVAWVLFGCIIGFIVLTILLVVLWWKMPQPAKRLLLNNLRGGNPIIANAYDDMSVRIETPRIFREGYFYDKRKGWYFTPRLTTDAANDLSEQERQIITKSFRLRGTNSSFYLAYSGKGVVVNPEIQALIEHDKAKKKGETVQIPKEILIERLKMMKEKVVTIKPTWISQFLDPRKIKEYMPKAITKSGLRNMEYKVREDERGKSGIGANAPIIIMVLAVIVLQAVCLLKQFNAF